MHGIGYGSRVSILSGAIIGILVTWAMRLLENSREVQCRRIHVENDNQDD